MKAIDTYVLEKLHLNKSNKNIRSISSIEEFIESYEGSDKKIIASLTLMAVNHLSTYAEYHECYVVKSNNSRDTTKPYKWSSNIKCEELNIGDTTIKGSTVLYVVKTGDTFPSSCKKYL